MSCASAGLSEPGVEGSNGLSLLGSVDLSDSWKISAALVACVGAVEVVHLPQQNQSSLGPLVALRRLLLLCLGHSTAKGFHGRDTVLFFPLPCL